MPRDRFKGIWCRNRISAITLDRSAPQKAQCIHSDLNTVLILIIVICIVIIIIIMASYIMNLYEACEGLSLKKTAKNVECRDLVITSQQCTSSHSISKLRALCKALSSSTFTTPQNCLTYVFQSEFFLFIKITITPKWRKFQVGKQSVVHCSLSMSISVLSERPSHCGLCAPCQCALLSNIYTGYLESVTAGLCSRLCLRIFNHSKTTVGQLTLSLFSTMYIWINVV
jgi:hypothetical protein